MSPEKNDGRPVEGDPADDRPGWMKKDFKLEPDDDDGDGGLEDMLGRGGDD